MNTVPPHKRQPPSNAIPNVDSLEGINNDDSDEYSTLKKLQRHLEYAISSSTAFFPLIMLDILTCKKSTSRMSRGKTSLVSGPYFYNLAICAQMVLEC